MVTKLPSYTTDGFKPSLVEIESDISRGLPSFRVVGLGDTCVQEAKERVKTAIKNSGYTFSMSRITVNLAPSDIKKEGSYFDLPIALGILGSSKQIDTQDLHRYLCAGELALDGTLRPVNNIIGFAMFAHARGIRRIIIPAENAARASAIPGITIFAARTLGEVVNHLNNDKFLLPFELPDQLRVKARKQSPHLINFEDINGQNYSKRALEIAAAGGHHILLSGPPGTGKTMLARALPSILPEMNKKERLEVSHIYDLAGLLAPSQPLVRVRPFRSPHHHATPATLVGHIQPHRVGELTLAHHGILFLDELPEFRRETIEVLRQPLEDGIVSLGSRKGSATYPSRFILVASMNPCPCGYAGDTLKECTCLGYVRRRYEEKLSGPLLDRIDLFVPIHRIPLSEMHSAILPKEEHSRVIKQRVGQARGIQRVRFARTPYFTNAHMGTASLKQFCVLGSKEEQFLETSLKHIPFSMRAYSRILKLARTIADLEGSNNISVQHLAESIQYRNQFGMRNSANSPQPPALNIY